VIQQQLEPFGPPLANVANNWPLIEAALVARGIYSDLTAVAAISTVRVESPSFAPGIEAGGPTYLERLYEGRKDLGNTEPGDGARFRGRGFIQITGRWDYQHFGQEVGKDLIANPDLARDPEIAAQIFALFFHERSIPQFANERRWDIVRRRVNGGLGNFQLFLLCVSNLCRQLNVPAQGAASAPIKTS